MPSRLTVLPITDRGPVCSVGFQCQVWPRRTGLPRARIQLKHHGSIRCYNLFTFDATDDNQEKTD